MKSLNEKIRFLMRNENELKTKCTDKILLREYCIKILGVDICPKIIGIYDTLNENDWILFPDEFVIKCNHGCKFNYLVKNKKEENFLNIKNKFDEYLKIDFSQKHNEIQYKNINRKIFIEEYIPNVIDYKISCFNGKPLLVEVFKKRDNLRDNLFCNTYDIYFNEVKDVFKES